MIEVIDLCKSFGDLSVLKGINLKIEQGEKVVIIGPSGSGKSTLLRCLNCMEDPTSGKVLYHGVDLTDMKVNINRQREKIGMVFQHFNLFNNKTVIENIMLSPVLCEKRRMRKLRRQRALGKADTKEPVKTTKQIKEEAHKNALELLDRIGLADKADVYPSQLSGGQKQRVAIVRALAMNPDVILFDEPTSAGSCPVCEKCTYPDAPCRFPDKARSAMEALGIDVVALAADRGITYDHGAGTVTYFSIVFYH